MRRLKGVIQLLVAGTLVALIVWTNVIPDEGRRIEDSTYVEGAVVLPENEGKRVIVAGLVEPTGQATDPDLGLTFPSPVARRTVERLKYSSASGWIWETIYDSSTTSDLKEATFAEPATLGEFTLAPELVSRLQVGTRSWYEEDVDAEELARLGGIVCEGEDFEPTITARDPRTIPEFYRMYGTSLTQTAALATLRAVMAPEDIIVCAGGSLPSDLQRVWKTDRRGGYHVEYGYSCMGYEIGASMGVRMADPDCEEYTVVGDAGFQMLSSELGTIMQERVKTNILVFDNCGFGCINNLE